MQIQINNKIKASSRIVAVLLALTMLLSLIGCDSTKKTGHGVSSGHSNTSSSEISSDTKDPESTSLKIKTDSTECGLDVFRDSDADVDIYFFDVYNIPDDNIGNKGENFIETIGLDFHHVKPAECYMIVCGDIEILVDAGYPSIGNYNAIANNCKENLLPKIAALISEDGILDYMIVTHGDFDHIASLGAANTVFDAFTQEESIIPIDSPKDSDAPEMVKLSYIKTIIDFDSNLVREHMIVQTAIYENYCQKRDETIEHSKEKDKGAAYVPAATLFSEEIMSEEHKENAQPNINNQTILTPSEKSQSEKYDLELIGGKLVEIAERNVETKENDKKQDGKSLRYYYEISLGNNTSLRILYNWFYDHTAGKSINEQSLNNISVCFQIKCGIYKFMSLGDLGGKGEEALLKYYSNTDVLENITCYKASHHASTHNLENSKELFEKMKPEIVIITGVAISATQQYLSNYRSVAIEKDFFDNVTSANENAIILGTNIAVENQQGNLFVSAPLCGDIHIKAKNNKVVASCTYIGQIMACSNGPDAVEITMKDGDGLLSLNNTEWYSKIYLEGEDE